MEPIAIEEESEINFSIKKKRNKLLRDAPPDLLPITAANKNNLTRQVVVAAVVVVVVVAALLCPGILKLIYCILKQASVLCQYRAYQLKR